MKLTYLAAALFALGGAAAALAGGGIHSRPSEFGGSGSVGASTTVQSETAGSGSLGSASISAATDIRNDTLQVKQIQQQLSHHGYRVAADGIVGPKTKAALKKFQRSQGLEANGSLDAATLSALRINLTPSQSKLDNEPSLGGSGSVGASARALAR